jgi:predicted transcriptional regulator
MNSWKPKYEDGTDARQKPGGTSPQAPGWKTRLLLGLMASIIMSFLAPLITDVVRAKLNLSSSTHKPQSAEVEVKVEVKGGEPKTAEVNEANGRQCNKQATEPPMKQKGSSGQAVADEQPKKESDKATKGDKKEASKQPLSGIANEKTTSPQAKEIIDGVVRALDPEFKEQKRQLDLVKEENAALRKMLADAEEGRVNDQSELLRKIAELQDARVSDRDQNRRQQEESKRIQTAILAELEREKEENAALKKRVEELERKEKTRDERKGEQKGGNQEVTTPPTGGHTAQQRVAEPAKEQWVQRTITAPCGSLLTAICKISGEWSACTCSKGGQHLARWDKENKKLILYRNVDGLQCEYPDTK